VTRRAVLIVSCAILLVGVAAVVFVQQQLRREHAEIRGFDRIEEERLAFERNPTVKGCFLLAAKYMEMDDTENGIRYAERCLAIGADKRPGAVELNMWLASMHNKEGRRDKTVAHLMLALSLQNERSIVSEEGIKELGLQSIYVEAQRQTRSRGKTESRAQ